METVTHGEFLEWKEANPLKEENHRIQKDVKFYDEVYMIFSDGGKPHKCYLLGRGADTPWGDTVELFFPRKSQIFHKGISTQWMQDIGLGKTVKEARANYMKYNWIHRQKSLLHNHIFWARKREQELCKTN